MWRGSSARLSGVVPGSAHSRSPWRRGDRLEVDVHRRRGDGGGGHRGGGGVGAAVAATLGRAWEREWAREWEQKWEQKWEQTSEPPGPAGPSARAGRHRHRHGRAIASMTPTVATTHLRQRPVAGAGGPAGTDRADPLHGADLDRGQRRQRGRGPPGGGRSRRRPRHRPARVTHRGRRRSQLRVELGHAGEAIAGLLGQRAQTAASSGAGTAGLSARGGSGGRLMCMLMSAPMPSDMNGGRPHSIS